jgi:hypothetical protein
MISKEHMKFDVEIGLKTFYTLHVKFSYEIKIRTSRPRQCFSQRTASNLT